MNNGHLNLIKLGDFRNVWANCEYYQFYIQSLYYANNFDSLNVRNKSI